MEGLKPKININYNALLQPVGGGSASSFSERNYKWGLDVSFPLFLREQRGQLQLTQLKIQETGLRRQQKLLQLQNKLREYHNEQVNLEGQVRLFTDAVNNYKRMLDGEKQKFEGGESSLFLINARELYLLQAQQQLIEQVTKFQITQSALSWSAGLLFEN
jgi:outer membrane protein TolC